MSNDIELFCVSGIKTELDARFDEFVRYNIQLQGEGMRTSVKR